jgi:pimeloyl-ACP methyl ester carboxylesterase
MAGCATALIYFFSIQSVYAATVIGQETYSTDAAWDSAGNPYVLTKTVTVLPGATLTISKGVEILSSTSPFSSSGINVAGGKLFIQGKGDSRVHVKGITNIFVTDGYAEIKNTDIEGGTGLSFTNSRVRIATTSISGAVQAIKSKESIVSIEGSHIKNNSNGIRVVPPQVLLVRKESGTGTGGIGNALDGSVPVTTPSLTVSNSSLAGNASLALGNFSTYKIEAPNNWWGESGPVMSGANRISGQISYEPALASEPVLDPGNEPEECCSSILFIPGFQGTRLYDGSDTLWEPTNNGDVRQLFLDETGSSINPDVYAGDVMQKAYGLVGIYDSFVKFLDSLKKKGTVQEWKAFGYDWRMPIAEVVAGTKRATSTDSLVETVERLAAASRTKKVSIVAHSNGGLVAKYLVKVLEEQGKVDLIDRVISVAVPFLGTPQAILGLLHGDNTEIVKGLIEDSSTAREHGKNMAAAYNLLPSAQYFKNLFSPTIAFASTSIIDINDGSYPLKIQTYSDQSSFLADAKDVRDAASLEDVGHPLSANQLLLYGANALHSVLDAYIWPDSILRWGIVGWNLITAKGVEYTEKTSCTAFLRLYCAKVLSHTPAITKLGDETVVVPSSAYDSGTAVSLDLQKLNQSDAPGLKHASIMEASTTQMLIEEMMTHPSYPDSFTLPPGTSWGIPRSEKGYIAISTHSPVELHVFDSSGHHTGPRPALQFDSAFAHGYEEGIPGSLYKTYGSEEDPDSYIYLPVSGEVFSIEIRGTNVGSATLQIERNTGENAEKISYSDIPVTPLTIIKTEISDADARSKKLASTTEPLSLDADGDGTTDKVIKFGDTYDPFMEIELLRKIVHTLIGDSDRAKYIDKKLVKIADQLSKGKLPQVTGSTQNLVRKLDHIKLNAATDSEKTALIELIESMIAQFE